MVHLVAQEEGLIAAARTNSGNQQERGQRWDWNRKRWRRKFLEQKLGTLVSFVMFASWRPLPGPSRSEDFLFID